MTSHDDKQPRESESAERPTDRSHTIDRLSKALHLIYIRTHDRFLNGEASAHEINIGCWAENALRECGLFMEESEASE